MMMSRTVFNPNLVKETYVISRYIDNPLLMGGKKFDLRLVGEAGGGGLETQTVTNLEINSVTKGYSDKNTDT